MQGWIQWTLLAGVSVAMGVLTVRQSMADSSPNTGAGDQRSPVIVELFTSEGCSSCPAADSLLRKLDKDGTVEGRPVLALGLHVDYWNNLGWPDAFSKPDFTNRQREYAQRLRADSVYTPQAIVNGMREFVGSNEDTMRRSIAAANDLSPSTVSVTDEGASAHVKVAPGAKGRVLLAVTEWGLSTQVRRGENAGRRLEHAPVVRVLKDLGVNQATGSPPIDTTVGIDPAWNREHVRFVAFVQDDLTGEIRSAGIVGFPK